MSTLFSGAFLVLLNKRSYNKPIIALAGSVVSELDPDAPSRTGRPLHPGNARSQERLMGRVWQLLRAGESREGGEGEGREMGRWRAFWGPGLLG